MNLCGNDIDLSREFERDFDIDIINNKEYYQNEEHGILVEVIPRYMPKVSNPEDGLYIFMYTIRVINNSELPIGVVNRYLKTKDGKGRKCDLFESASLIGEPTVVGPGLTFEYTTSCALSTSSGNMRGKYQMADQFGNQFWVDIPVFFFRRPESFV